MFNRLIRKIIGLWNQITIVVSLCSRRVRCLVFTYLSSASPSGGRYVRELACATGVAVLSWVVTLLSVLILALLVTLLGRSMFWYNHFYASICLYGAAATGKMVLIHTLAKNLYYGVSTVFNLINVLALLMFSVCMLS